jgi:FlaA1/EpsC-like NDP-sugar epimerase
MFQLCNVRQSFPKVFYKQIKAIFQPEIIFHAAAHKHVPLMEENPEDAITNNVLGTKNLVQQAEEHNVERFVLISTDKAVDPVNIMGMTKRVAELIVKQAADRTGKPYVSVRFGNVLGSRGSVVPLFQRQIAAGGPVTVTHPDVERYFMTNSEAVQLVLQAAALGVNGEIFILEMGKQIKIRELAEQMIQLSGLRLGEDIDITYTGLRPGEKFSEKLYSEEETIGGTKHQKIYRIMDHIQPSPDEFDKKVNDLIHRAEKGEQPEARTLLEELSSV